MLRASLQILPAAIAALCVLPHANAADDTVAAASRFLRVTPAQFRATLAAERLPRLSSVFTAQVLATLPRDGEVKRLSRSAEEKVAAIHAVLREHGRDGEYVIKLIESRQARVALHERFILLLTDTALRMLSAAELQAVVAHEIGHEYVWGEYEAAKREGTWAKVRELELVCDGVAMVTMARIGSDPGILIHALRRLQDSDRENGLSSTDSRSHPQISDRARFAREIGKWLETRVNP
jgi:predicted Zn-dependent protease